MRQLIESAWSQASGRGRRDWAILATPSPRYYGEGAGRFPGSHDAVVRFLVDAMRCNLAPWPTSPF